MLQLGKRPEHRAFSDQFTASLLPHLLSLCLADPLTVNGQLFVEALGTLALAGALAAPSLSPADPPRPAVLVAAALIGVLARYGPSHHLFTSVRPTAVQGVMALAKVQPDAFRGVVGSLDTPTRTILEDALRSAASGGGVPGGHFGGSGGGDGSAARAEKPTIELKGTF